MRFGSFRWLPAAALVSCLLSPGIFLGSLAAQDLHCDPQLKQSNADPTGYRTRGDRCEGVYFREVGSTTLLVASLTESVEDFDPATGKPLLLEWSAPAGSAVHIRARALRHRLYYQMDTLRPLGSSSYTWPANLLAKLNLRRNELGLLAWTPYALGGSTHDLYVPLRVSQTAGARSATYQLLLLPGVELSEVFVSLAKVGSDGRAEKFIQKDEPLKSSFYPADRVVTVPLPTLETPGIYYLEVKALRRGGGSASAPPLWFYHSGR